MTNPSWRSCPNNNELERTTGFWNSECYVSELFSGTIKDYFDEVNKQTAELEGEAVARPPGAGQETPPETRRDAAPEDARRDAFFPTLAGDFFPYTDERDEYWTGYFSTRPFDKLAGPSSLETHTRAHNSHVTFEVDNFGPKSWLQSLGAVCAEFHDQNVLVLTV